MASESIIGGVAQNLSQESLALLNAFLADTVLGSTLTQDVGGGSNLVIGSGSHGEKQGAVTPPTAPITMSMNDGVLELKLALPANVGVFFEGKDHLAAADVTGFLGEQLNKYLPNPPAGSPQAEQKAKLLEALGDVSHALQSAGATNIQVRVLDFLNTKGTGGQQGAIGPNEILFDASGSPGSTVFAFNLYGVTQTVVLQNVQAAVFAEKGSVRIEGNTSARLQGDTNDQNITGGGGNDTLVGGGGHDTMTGGAGSDIFGFNALGNYLITDAQKGLDQFAFSVPGVSSVADLAKYLTGINDTAGNVTFFFGDSSITLVGLHASDVTTDMIKFTI